MAQTYSIPRKAPALPFEGGPQAPALCQVKRMEDGINFYSYPAFNFIQSIMHDRAQLDAALIKFGDHPAVALRDIFFDLSDSEDAYRLFCEVYARGKDAGAQTRRADFNLPVIFATPQGRFNVPREDCFMFDTCAAIGTKGTGKIIPVHQGRLRYSGDDARQQKRIAMVSSLSLRQIDAVDQTYRLIFKPEIGNFLPLAASRVNSSQYDLQHH